MRTSTTVARRALDVAGVCVFVVACPLPQAHAAVVSGPGRDECVSGPGGAESGVWVTASASAVSGAGVGPGAGDGNASPSPWPSHSAAPKPSASTPGESGGTGGGGRTGISAAETSAADSGDGATPRVRSGRNPLAPWGTQGSVSALDLAAPAGAGMPIQIGSPSLSAPAKVSSQASAYGSTGPVVPRPDHQRAAALARDRRRALALLTTLLIIALVPVVLHLALRRRGRR